MKSLRSLLSCFIVTAFVTTNSNASAQTDTILKHRLDNVEKKLTYQEKSLKVTNDSLNKELFFYKVKQDYFIEALSEQSSKYIFICGLFVALTGLFSFTTLVTRNKLLKKDYLDQTKLLKEEIKTSKETTYEHDVRLTKIYSNLFILAANIENKAGHFVDALNYRVTVTMSQTDLIKLRSEGLKDKDEQKNKKELEKIRIIAITNINRAIELLAIIKNKPEDKAQLINNKEEILEMIQKIISVGDDELIDLACGFRKDLIEYLK